jgi:murein tripeptide amidase MpaA
MARMVSISSAFDGGNIEVDSQTAEAVKLRIKPDPFTLLEQKSHMQSFAFKATADSTSPEQKVVYEIINAKDVSFPSAWDGTTVCFSTDRETWHRVGSTSYDGAKGVLRWEWTHAGADSSVFFAYFDLYPYERQLRLVAKCAAMAAGAQPPAGLRVRSLGQTLDGRELDCISVGTGPLQAWAIHRQHPGESQASFFAEGLLDRLLGLGTGGVTDALTQRALLLFTFHVVPNMNPDGSVRGYLRVNAGGANLNREWAPTKDYAAPTADRSPEVLHTVAALHATGVDLFIDVHGDEALPFCFMAGAEGLGVWGPRHKALHGAFVAAYNRANPDMQGQFGYDPEPALGGNPTICSNHVAQTFDALAVTLEMPFKDCASNPQAPPRGWDGRRCAMLGANFIDAAVHVAPQLRNVQEPKFGEADEYVTPTEDMQAIAAFLARGHGL